MMFGTISGCYSTICIAGPLWTMLENHRKNNGIYWQYCRCVREADMLSSLDTPVCLGFLRRRLFVAFFRHDANECKISGAGVGKLMLHIIRNIGY